MQFEPVKENKDIRKNSVMVLYWCTQLFIFKELRLNHRNLLKTLVIRK